MSDTIQPSIPVINIVINGQSDSMLEEDVDLCVVDTSINLPSMATLHFFDPNGEKANNSTFDIGASIVIKMGPSKEMQAVSPAQVFVGEIVALEPSFNAIGTGTFTIRAYDLSHRLHYGTKSRTFLNMKDGDIAKMMAQEHGLTADTSKINMAGAMHDYLVQSNLSDFEFLMTRAKRTGCILAVIDGKFCFDTPKHIFSDGPLLTMQENLRQFNVRMSAALQATKVIARGWDYTTKQQVKSEVIEPKKLWNTNGASGSGADVASSTISGSKSITELITYGLQTTDEANVLATAAAADQEGAFIEADATAYGHPGLVAGVRVDIEKLGDQYNGKYFVTSATHIFNASGYEVHFVVAGRYTQSFNHLLNGSHSTPIEPGSIPSVVIGLVTNNHDPDNLGRVKVKFPWMVAGSSEVEIVSNWARVAAIGAGKQRGMFYLPELDDEVLVAFEHGNPNLPYVIGGLWNGKDAPPETNQMVAPDGAVDRRLIFSRKGHKIVFSDKDGSESILIMDQSGKQSLLMESKGDITLKGQGNLLIDMLGNVTIKSGQTITMEANADVNMKGINVNVEASGICKVDGTTEVAMKGGTVLIDGTTGPVKITAKPIMLN